MRKFQLQMIDGIELINFEWAGEKPPKAIIQVVHNIDEHMSIYAKIAEKMNEKNILVIGTDLRGMGESAIENGEKGYFSKHQGWNNLVEDLRTVNTFIRREYPNIPIFMLAQSVGTDLALTYAIQYCETINGLILLSAKSHNTLKVLPPLLHFMLFSQIFSKWPSEYLFKNLNRKVTYKNEDKIKNAWMTSDHEFLQEYNENDELKQKWVTTSANKDVLSGQYFVSKFKNIDMLDKDLPILLMSGDKDPYTNFSKSTRKLFSKFIKIGLNPDFIVYKGSRNRILLDKEQSKAINDIISFIDKNLN